MTIFSFPPTPGFSASRFGLESNTAAFPSLFTKAAQTVEWPGARWRGSFTLPPLRGAQAAAWQAFLVSLRGAAGRFYAGDPDYAVSGPRGTAAGAGVVSGAGQTGTTLVTAGWTANQATLFAIGDQIAFDTPAGRELKMIVAPASSDGTGAATLVFEPPLRNSPNEGATILTDAPTCVMRLESPEVVWDSNALRMASITFDAVEAL